MDAAAKTNPGLQTRCWHFRMEGILDTAWMQILSGGIIMVNAIVIGFETDFPHKVNWSVIEDMFFMYFFLEVVARFSITGPAAYFGLVDDEAARREAVWNIFDMVVVSGSLFDFMGKLLFYHKHGLHTASVIRAVRILRILRIFRIFRYLKQLYLLASGFVDAAIAVFWVAVLMGFVLYVCAILLRQNYSNLPTSDPYQSFFADRFGSVPQAMLTLFEIMSSPDLVVYQDPLLTHRAYSVSCCIRHLWQLWNDCLAHRCDI